MIENIFGLNRRTIRAASAHIGEQSTALYSLVTRTDDCAMVDLSPTRLYHRSRENLLSIDRGINMLSDRTAASNCALGRPLDCGLSTGIDAPLRDYDALISTVALVDFPESVDRLVRISLGEGQSQIRSIASAVGISVRTLQRRLAECGIEYSALVEGARFEIAADLLKNQRCKLIDIAYDVGYADPGSFTRAFRRWTGVTPSEYCQLHYSL